MAWQFQFHRQEHSKFCYFANRSGGDQSNRCSVLLHTIVIPDSKACAQAREHVKDLHVNGGEGVHVARQIGCSQPQAIGDLSFDAHGSVFSNYLSVQFDNNP